MGGQWWGEEWMSHTLSKCPKLQDFKRGNVKIFITWGTTKRAISNLFSLTPVTFYT